MPKLKSLGSPGSNIKSFFHDQSELLSDLPSGSTSRKKAASSRPPRAKADATKREQRTRSNRPKGARDSGLMQQSERSSAKKQEVAPILSKEADAKVSSIIVDKDCHPKDASEQPNPVAIEFKTKLPCDALNAPASCMSGSHYEQHGAPDSGKEAQSKVPLSDPICCFTSDDEEMTHAPTKKCKRPFVLT